MKQRCDYKRAPSYHRYGGRGITYDPRWAEFKNFLLDMGERPEGHNLERKDSNGNYTKDNCRWATMKEQQNNRRNNVMITVGETTKTAGEWSEVMNIPVARILARHRQGWSDLESISSDRSKRSRANKEWGL